MIYIIYIFYTILAPDMPCNLFNEIPKISPKSWTNESNQRQVGVPNLIDLYYLIHRDGPRTLSSLKKSLEHVIHQGT